MATIFISEQTTDSSFRVMDDHGTPILQSPLYATVEKCEDAIHELKVYSAFELNFICIKDEKGKYFFTINDDTGCLLATSMTCFTYGAREQLMKTVMDTVKFAQVVQLA